MSHTESAFVPLNIAIMTISDTRTEDTDTSGRYLATAATDAGHFVVAKHIVPDDIYQIRALASAHIASQNIQAVLMTGGTGFAGRDSTPEAMAPLFDKQVEGFGELFRQVSVDDIGSSTIQSRALAGLANGTIIFCMPGSSGACKTAWQHIIAEQLDARHRPCNFVANLKKPAQ
ncbi:molybdenum cofactor biosynthesis protein B [Bowmanella sp. JS7-9]|uniref:Molybdenum cofactor biosynthesis protein B n=1 Tax=Pseudobowmanella zhangzhouensis TaxID=1537679 RepID=A0ABW1XFY8_9ALTE|nr:molybdenum cofactor biosynthesis protein B [Bowmanella sp. JS7-9]TBX20962.1 molybdopterin biosynthesis protein B [Bowmanella sp. JS7-9]